MTKSQPTLELEPQPDPEPDGADLGDGDHGGGDPGGDGHGDGHGDDGHDGEPDPPIEIDSRGASCLSLTPLSAREEQLTTLLLSGVTTTEAARSMGISRRTATRLKSTATFKEHLRAQQSELFESALSKLRASASGFASTLATIATDVRVQARDRVSASREGLAALIRGLELTHRQQQGEPPATVETLLRLIAAMPAEELDRALELHAAQASQMVPETYDDDAQAELACSGNPVENGVA